MFKWLGAILMILTSTWIGLEWSRNLSRRPKQIRQLKNALQILEAEIKYSQTPLKLALEVVSKQVPDPTANLFKEVVIQLEAGQASFINIWEKSVINHAKETSLKMNECEILIQFGQTLGQHDVYQQEKQIVLASNHLERELVEARDLEQKYSNMAKTLGFLGGLFIVLMLI